MILKRRKLEEERRQYCSKIVRYDDNDDVGVKMY